LSISWTASIREIGMRGYFHVFLVVAVAAAGLATFFTPSRLTLADAQPVVATSYRKESVKRFLQAFDSDRTARYIAVFYDLTGDGKSEAIIYLMSNGWCGTGGCNTLILQEDASSWRIVSNQTITRPPIRVLVSTSRGWHSIGVWRQGGSPEPGYEAELRFDGQTYRTIVPQAKNSAGEVVIASIDRAIPLYP